MTLQRKTPLRAKPSDICIVLCAFPGAHEDGWVDARTIAHRLERLGFDVPRSTLGSTLARIGRMDAPPLEVRRESWGYAYRVTGYGETWIHNRLPDIWWALRRRQYAVERGQALLPRLRLPAVPR